MTKSRSKTVLIDRSFSDLISKDGNNPKNGHYIKLYKRDKKILKSFFSVANNEIFYELAELVLKNIKDPKQLVQCAELTSQREPGGAFYRVKLWARAIELLDSRNGQRTETLNFNRLCKLVGVRPSSARDYITQGRALASAEKQLGRKLDLHEANSAIFRFAQRQKDRASEYLIKTAKILSQIPKATPTYIHRKWCQENGSLKTNLDIIKPSDWWAFSHPKWRQESDFPGSIPGEIYANALYYFAPRKGVAVDSMAGSGMLKRVYGDRELWQKDLDFDLEVHLFDLYPRRKFIKRHDARKPLPIKADWIFLDPPYFGQSNHLYKGDIASAKTYHDYLKLMEEVIHAMKASLNPGGRLCALLPKWSGHRPKDPNYNIPADIQSLTIRAGLCWIDSAFISRGRQQEPGSAAKNNWAKRNRRMRSDTCILNVFEKLRGSNV